MAPVRYVHVRAISRADIRSRHFAACAHVDENGYNRAVGTADVAIDCTETR
jgi:hypothetical protein